MNSGRPMPVHPRTVLWFEERKQCLVCSNRTPLFGGPEMRCKATGHEFCIDAREPGQPCGPEGKLFSPVVV